MNTNGLAKLYDRLAPMERLSLILAATARGDDAERERLASSAPMETYRLPDYHGLAEGMLFAALFHMIELLDTAALYWQVQGLVDQEGGLGKAGNKALLDRFTALVRAFGYILTARVDGWKLFCAGLKAGPDLLLRGIPGLETAGRAEEAARGMAFSAAEMADWVRRGKGGPARVMTAETEAAAWRTFLEARAGWWG